MDRAAHRAANDAEWAARDGLAAKLGSLELAAVDA